MAKNELLPFANGEDANILPTNQWEALTDILENGFQSGIARSEQVNRVLAQGAVASYVLGQLIVDELNQDATLDKDTLYQRLVSALESKAKDVCLPLSGGTMTGNVYFPFGSVINGNNEILFSCSPDPSLEGQFPVVALRNGNHGTPYSFLLCSRNSENGYYLEGRIDGALTWNGNKVSVVNLNGHTFIRYDDGTQICWGRIDVQANQSTATQTFPCAFAYDDYAITITTLDDSVTSYPFNIGTRTTTGFTAWCRSTNQFGRAASWIAIGRWW